MTQKLNVIELTQQLIACHSVSPNDAGCQEIIGQMLTSYNFTLRDMHFHDVKNLWASYKLSNDGPTLVFAGHTDVVPPGEKSHWHTDPFKPIIKNDILYGRGACDMKGGLAAMLCAACAFITQTPNFKGNIAFLITSDEEATAENGTKKVIQKLVQENTPIDAVVIGEPSSDIKIADTIRYGRRGSITFTLNIQGTQGHVAYPQLADNPIHKIGTLVDNLSNYKWDEGNENFPPSSLQIVSIKAGGAANNIIPGEVSLVCNLRFSNQHTAEQIVKTMQQIVANSGLSACTQITHNISGMPFLTKKSSTLVQLAQKSIMKVCGYSPALSTGGGTSDGRFIAPFGIDVIELGVRNATAHKANENVSCRDLILLVDIYKDILHRFFQS